MNQYWIGVLVVVVGGIVLALAIWGIKQFVQQGKIFQNQQDTILQNGVCVVGRIIEYRDDSAASRYGSHTFYHVTYRYEYDGKTYTHEQEVSKQIYLASPDETQVSVHFLPADPITVVTTFDAGSS